MPPRRRSRDAALCAAWQACSTLPSAGGSLPLSTQLCVGAPQGQAVVAFTLASTTQSSSRVIGAVAPQLAPLVAAATPSPFGRGRRTVHDPAVRSALEIKGVMLNQTLPTQEVLEAVHQLLAPNASSVSAELDKLNIYAPGGFFKPHYDTPRSEDHFGTLIICLPSPFKGGQLVLRHTDPNRPAAAASLTKTYDWSLQPEEGVAGQLKQLQWAAFFSDTEHEVLPMTEGHRITLTFNLRATHSPAGGSAAAEEVQVGSAGAWAEQTAVTHAARAAAADGGDEEEEQDDEWMTAADISSSRDLTGKIEELLADETWHPDGDRLGFVLQHKYCRSLRGLAGLPFPTALKGPDRLLGAALQQAGLTPRVVPLFRGWSGMTDFMWQDREEYEAAAGGNDREPNFGRRLQPAQQADAPQQAAAADEDAYWQLLVGDFDTCASTIDCGGMNEDLSWDPTEFSSSVSIAFNVEEKDIAWVTPVLDEHFTYYSSILAGKWLA